MGLIKTEIRNSLKEVHLNDFSQISINGESLSDFNFSAIIELWKMMRKRSFV